MGVYHLMGLGLSPGAITGPLSYLARRYQRWNSEDQQFFSRSGEVAQRLKGEKVGNVQALVLFTTPEVISGEVLSYPYTDNKPGTVRGAEKPRAPMQEVLCSLLKQEWSKISGGRRSVSIFWCKVDRRDIYRTYERIVQVVVALAKVGGQGKELWVNLTGGNNVTNFALQLVAALSGDVARIYYIQAENQDAEKCVQFTAEEGYWVELPVLPIGLNNLNLAVLDLLSEEKMNAGEIFSRLKQHQNFWNLVQDLSDETFKGSVLTSMWKQGLIANEGGSYMLGSQWQIIQPYERLLKQAEIQIQQSNLTLEKLAQQTDWLEKQELVCD